MNKKEDLAAPFRAIGSIAFRNVPRSVVVIAESKEKPGRRLLMQEKTNLIADKYAAAFTMRTVAGNPRVEWDHEWQTVDVDEIVARKTPTNKKTNRASAGMAG